MNLLLVPLSDPQLPNAMRLPTMSADVRGYPEGKPAPFCSTDKAGLIAGIFLTFSEGTAHANEENGTEEDSGADGFTGLGHRGNLEAP